MDTITDMKVYQDDDGQVYRFLWQRFSESVRRATVRERRQTVVERLADAGGVSDNTVLNHLRTRTTGGANFSCDISIIRAYGRELEGDEDAFLEPYTPRPGVGAGGTTGPKEALAALRGTFEGWPEEDRRTGEEMFSELWELLGLYAVTERYNRRPDTGEIRGADEYFAARLGDIRHKALSAGEGEARRLLEIATEEAGAFVGSYELPGVPDRWLRMNPRLGFFDPVFELAESQTPEMSEGLDAAGRLRVPLPTPWERRMRGLYFSAMDGDEAAWFTRELQETLVRVFREADCAGDGNVVE